MARSAAQEFAYLFRLPPQQAIDYLQGRDQLTRTYSWQDLWHDEHTQQFTVSRLARMDILKAMQDSITASVGGDLTRRDWIRDTKALLKKEGWWGEKTLIDEFTGEAVTTKFDSARLKLIFDTNTRQAYAAGLWQRIADNKAARPYIRYITRRDGRVRAQHQRCDNLVLPVDDPFWKTRFPPNGYRCRCHATGVSQAEYDKGYSEYRANYEFNADGTVKRIPDVEQIPFNKVAPPDDLQTFVNQRTGDISEVPAGVMPGFDFNPGMARAYRLRQVAAEKVAALPAPLAQAALADGVYGGNLPEALARVETEIVGEPLEHLVLLDSKGTELARAVGTEDMVELPGDMLAQLTDGVLIHNHPGPPQSFTVEDIKLAVWHGLAATHVVDSEFRYSAIFPEGIPSGPAYWVEVLEPMVSRIEADVTRRVNDAIAAGLIGKDESAPIIDHMIWEEVNAEVNIGYRRIRRKNDAV